MQTYFDNEKRNLSPENLNLKFTGERKTENVTINAVYYNDKQFEEKTVPDFDQCLPFRDDGAINWITVSGLHEVGVVENIGKSLGLHPLLIEDILHLEHLPKIEYYDTYIFLIVKIISYSRDNDDVHTDHVSIVFGENYLVSFLEKPSAIFDGFKEKLKSRKTRATRLAADYLNYSLIDGIVDNYADVLEQTREDIEDLEETLLNKPDEYVLRRIQRLKRVLRVMRRYVVPLKEVIRNMEIDDSSLTKDSTDPYLKDLYDHIVQVIDSIELQNERLSEMITFYLTTTSNRLNEIMKVLTVISTIFIPLTFVSSIYGMNFKFMPELGTAWGYPAVMTLMLIMGLGMGYYFKRKKWF